MSHLVTSCFHIEMFKICVTVSLKLNVGVLIHAFLYTWEWFANYIKWYNWNVAWINDNNPFSELCLVKYIMVSSMILCLPGMSLTTTVYTGMYATPAVGSFHPVICLRFTCLSHMTLCLQCLLSSKIWWIIPFFTGSLASSVTPLSRFDIWLQHLR